MLANANGPVYTHMRHSPPMKIALPYEARSLLRRSLWILIPSQILLSSIAMVGSPRTYRHRIWISHKRLRLLPNLHVIL
jgi:hypothetical protein